MPSGLSCSTNCKLIQKAHDSVLCLLQTDVPSAPQGVEVLEVTKDSAKITWKVPESDGGSPIIGYVIERSLAGKERWLRANNQLVPELTYCVPELVEDNEYVFRVIAENKVGQGEPSEPTKPVVAKDPWRKFIYLISILCAKVIYRQLKCMMIVKFHVVVH